MVGGFPLRRWRIELCMLDNDEKEIEADILSCCTIHLHPTFKEPIRRLTSPPFVVEEDGWGEFEFKIVCTFIENAGKFTIRHSLSFKDAAYAVDYSVRIPYHIPALRERLSKHFTLPKNAIEQFIREQQSPICGKWINLIPLLDEDAVTEIVQMIVSHPAVQDEVNKHPKDQEFVMGLHQLPNELLKQIGDYVHHGKDVDEALL